GSPGWRGAGERHVHPRESAEPADEDAAAQRPSKRQRRGGAVFEDFQAGPHAQRGKRMLAGLLQSEPAPDSRDQSSHWRNLVAGCCELTQGSRTRHSEGNRARPKWIEFSGTIVYTLAGVSQTRNGKVPDHR